MHLMLSNYSIWGFCIMVLCSWLKLAEWYFNCTLPVFYYFVSYKERGNYNNKNNSSSNNNNNCSINQLTWLYLMRTLIFTHKWMFPSFEYHSIDCLFDWVSIPRKQWLLIASIGRKFFAVISRDIFLKHQETYYTVT